MRPCVDENERPVTMTTDYELEMELVMEIHTPWNSLILETLICFGFMISSTLKKQTKSIIGVRWCWVVSVTPRSPYRREEDPVLTV